MKRTGACQLQYVSDRSHKPRLAVVWVTPTPRAVAETGHHQQCNNLKEIPLIPAQMGGTPRTKSTGNTPSSSRLSWVISLKRFYINDIPMKALNCFGDYIERKKRPVPGVGVPTEGKSARVSGLSGAPG